VIVLKGLVQYIIPDGLPCFDLIQFSSVAY
jgi:hypothetical protein